MKCFLSLIVLQYSYFYSLSFLISTQLQIIYFDLLLFFTDFCLFYLLLLFHYYYFIYHVFLKYQQNSTAYVLWITCFILAHNTTVQSLVPPQNSKVISDALDETCNSFPSSNSNMAWCEFDLSNETRIYYTKISLTITSSTLKHSLQKSEQILTLRLVSYLYNVVTEVLPILDTRHQKGSHEHSCAGVCISRRQHFPDKTGGHWRSIGDAYCHHITNSSNWPQGNSHEVIACSFFIVP